MVGTQDDVESNKCGNLLFKIGFIKGKHIMKHKTDVSFNKADCLFITMTICQ